MHGSWSSLDVMSILTVDELDRLFFEPYDFASKKTLLVAKYC